MTQPNKKPASRPCTQCGQLLQPFLMATGIDSDYTTRRYWGFGHHCPKQAKRYNNRIKEIKSSLTMSDEQKSNATRLASYMNSWGA